MNMRQDDGRYEDPLPRAPFQPSKGAPLGRLRVEVDPSHSRWAMLRDGLHVRVPFIATFTPEPTNDVPATDPPSVSMIVEEYSGALIIAEVTYTAQSAHRPIRAATLRTYSLERLAQLAASRAAAPWWSSPDDIPTEKMIEESIVAATRARTSVDRQRLDDVATLYAAGRVRAVAEGLRISRSQAYRLIKLAREQGHIEEDHR